ncbi:MAG TPA: type II toxin-antitoxin system death-on-curing family toxin [Myxococcales bacterium]
MKAAFVSLDEVLALHADQISRYGGEAGVRDLALLTSALAVPQARFGGQWLHPTLHEMAAAYLFHLIRNHPFIDGNKRAGLVCAIAFLGLNGLELIADPDDLVELVLGVAEGRTDKAQVAVFLKANTR